jgi:hypothetical protein
LVLAGCGARPPESVAHVSTEDGVRWIDIGPAVRDVSVAPGRVAAVGEDGSIRVVDLPGGGSTVVRPADAAAPPAFLSLSPDGRLLTLCVGTEMSVIEIARGTYGLAGDSAPCIAPALWSRDATLTYGLLQEHTAFAFDVRTGPTGARGDVLGPDTFLARDGTIVSHDDHEIALLDAELHTMARFTMPQLDGEHEGDSPTFVLAMVDHETFVFASGQTSYDVALVRRGALERVLWQSPQHERWIRVAPIDESRAWILAERAGATTVRVVNVSTGQALLEVPSLGEPFDVSADGTTAAGIAGSRLGVARAP